MKISNNPVISNNSPLVALSGLNKLSLLNDLFTEVWIPRAVEREFLRTNRDFRKQTLRNAPWIKTVDLTEPISTEFKDELDHGEVEVLVLAKEHNARLILIDEKKARLKAQEIGVIVMGTVGILLEAKKKGLITSVRPLLIEMHNNGMHLSESIIKHALSEADEEYRR